MLICFIIILVNIYCIYCIIVLFIYLLIYCIYYVSRMRLDIITSQNLPLLSISCQPEAPTLMCIIPLGVFVLLFCLYLSITYTIGLFALKIYTNFTIWQIPLGKLLFSLNVLFLGFLHIDTFILTIWMLHGYSPCGPQKKH